MKRRRLLAALGATGITPAGCLAGGSTADDSGPVDDSTDGSADDPDPNEHDGTDGSGGDEPRSRVDEPPCEIERPEPPGNPGDDWNALYLCAHMASEPSLAFETAAGGALAAGLDLSEHAGEEYHASLLVDEGDVDRFEEMSDNVESLIEGTSFDEEALLVVETGWGSGSVEVHLKRIEAVDDGVHAFGCHTDPYVQTADYASRLLVARFERPDGPLDRARVSLTVAEDRRVHFDSTEGVVTLAE